MRTASLFLIVFAQLLPISIVRQLSRDAVSANADESQLQCIEWPASSVSEDADDVELLTASSDESSECPHEHDAVSEQPVRGDGVSPRRLPFGRASPEFCDPV